MAVGIIAEFNPFHNGHKYLLEAAKQITQEPIVVIMSGSFVQRGGISVTDKLTRAGAAIENGADLVIELPVPFSHNTAQKFAMSAVETLGACGIIDTIAFGSESANTNGIENAAEILANEPTDVSEKIKKFMAGGISYPAARQKAYEGYFDTSLLNTPNDILAIEYMRACRILGYNFSPLAIKRKGTKHDSSCTTDTIASATEIRRRILLKDKISDFLPKTRFNVYDYHILDTAVISQLRLCEPQYLSTINEVNEGLENRFIAAAGCTDSVDELCMAVKSKRYTLSKIRRIAYSSLIGLTKDIASLPPSYIRILAANESGRKLLKAMKKNASLPIITKPADYSGDLIFDINARAEDIFALCSTDKAKRCAGSDLRMTPIIK